MKKRSVLTSLDPNIRPALITDRAAYMARFERLLAATDLLKLSDEDLAWLYPGTDIDTAVQQLLDVSAAKLLVVTQSADGAFALAGGGKVAVDSAPVQGMKDTVGAGDTFMATLLAVLVQNGALDGEFLANISASDMTTLLERAAVAAALNCEKSGCNPPTLSELEARLSLISGTETK